MSSVTTNPARLLAGMMVATDLDQTRRFYETFLGLDCVRPTPDRLLARDQRSKAAMAAGDDDYFVLDVRRVDAIGNPQRQLHHWGLTVSNASEVDRIRAAAKAMKEELGLRKLFPVVDIHGSHSFYMADRDMNWWEIERRIDGRGNEDFFALGDFDPQRRIEAPAANDAPVPPRDAGDPIVVGAELSHGTMEQMELEKSRPFIEQVLGLRCVRHIPPAQIVAGPGSFGIFGIRLPRLKPQHFQNRWIVGVESAAEVRGVAERALAASELGLMSVEMTADGQACNIQDADGNWWQAVANDHADYAASFARGDRSA